MKFKWKEFFLGLLFLGASLSLSHRAWARGGGGDYSLGGGLAFSSPTQSDLNAHIDGVNSSQSVAVDKLGTSFEFFAHFTSRFSGSMFALHFRPSYFTQSASGGSYDYSLSGLTFFPMLRLYPLENNFIHFFLQGGLGFGRLAGKVKQPNGNLEFSGTAFGATAGLGAEFCFFDGSHCLVLEGNARYLPIERNIVSASTGTIVGFSQTFNNQELEYSGGDLKTTLSGIQGGLSYSYQF